MGRIFTRWTRVCLVLAATNSLPTWANGVDATVQVLTPNAQLKIQAEFTITPTAGAAAQRNFGQTVGHPNYVSEVPLDRRWVSSQWVSMIDQFGQLITSTLFNANMEVNRHSNSSEGFERGTGVLLAAIHKMAENNADNNFDNYWFHPLLHRLAVMAVDLDSIIFQNVRQGDQVDHEQRYKYLYMLLDLMRSEGRKFDREIYSQYAVGPVLNINQVEAAYLRLVGRMMDYLRKANRVEYVNLEGTKKVVPQAGFSAFFASTAVVTSFAYHELLGNLYGVANVCALQGLLQANGFASHWLRSLQPDGTNPLSGYVYMEQVLESLEKVDVSEKLECHYYKTHPWHPKPKNLLNRTQSPMRNRPMSEGGK